MTGSRIGVLVLLGALAAAPTETAAQASTSVVVELSGDVDPGFATALVAELGANGLRALFTREPKRAQHHDGLSLRIEVDGTGGRAVARRGSVVLGAAPLPGDPDAAALGASSLLFEAAPPPPLATPAATDALDDPAAPSWSSITDLSVPAPEAKPNRGLVLELGAVTAIVANGGTLGVGLFVEDFLLLRVAATALHLWANDSVAGTVTASIGYVARLGVADFEADVDLGIVGVDLGRQGSVGASLGLTGGVAFATGDLLSVFVRLGAAAAWIEDNLVPGLMLSLGLRVHP